MPVGEFTAIVMLTPLLITLLAALTLGERISAWRWLLLAGGMAGALIVIRPKGVAQDLGWAALLPLVLATLGGVFAASGMGEAVASLVSMVIPPDNRMACLLAFALGMVLFTVIMGNAFAAFPVMMAGIGLPLLVQRHGATPAVLGSLGMLTGYCGTLLTPMAANFNIVPAVLLELRDQYGVIRAQWPTAIVLLAVNVVLMALLVWR